MDRKIWRKSYGSIPGLPCPRCKPGTLRSNSKLFYRKQPKYVTTGLSELELHDVSEGRFTCFLTCDYGFCGEVVAVSGDFRSHDEYVFNPDTEEHDVFEDKALVPKSMVPAPPIIKWPEKLDSVPRQHLFHSFELFWMDRGACAGRLRIFIEALLDQLGVVREGIKRNGKKGTLDLSERIDELDKMKPGHKAALDALRHVGNFGSHEGDADFEDLIVCYDILETTLVELIEDKRAKLDAEIAAIIDRKGKPRT